jgi:metal-responsive CopG/Arc/MetJ family transcriptional regulator
LGGRAHKGEGRLVQPIQRVNVDLAAGMLKELDEAARELNVSRQAMITTLVRQALDQHYLAQRARSL